VVMIVDAFASCGQMPIALPRASHSLTSAILVESREVMLTRPTVRIRVSAHQHA